MVVQGIVVNSGNQQESGSNIKVLKINYGEDLVEQGGGMMLLPVATIVENTTGETFTVENEMGVIKITPTNIDYFNVNNYFTSQLYTIDDSGPIAIPDSSYVNFIGTSGSFYFTTISIVGTVTVFIL